MLLLLLYIFIALLVYGRPVKFTIILSLLINYFMALSVLQIGNDVLYIALV